MEKNLTLFSMIVFVILYIISWIIVTLLFYGIGSANPYGMTGTNIFLFCVLQISALTCFLLAVFYSPWNHDIQKKIDDSKKKYDSLKVNTEEVYQNQIKAFWIDALNQQNRYYFISFMILSLLPFFYFLIHILTHSVSEINTFLNHTFSFLLLTISVFYTALLLLFYSVSINKFSFTLIPVLLFIFLGGIFYFQRPFPFLTTIGFIALCFIESMLVLSNVAIYWCLIPLVPFYLTLFILYAQ